MLPRALNAFDRFLCSCPLGCRAVVPPASAAAKEPPSLEKFPILDGVPLDNQTTPPGALADSSVEYVLEGVVGQLEFLLPPPPIRKRGFRLILVG